MIPKFDKSRLPEPCIIIDNKDVDEDMSSLNAVMEPCSSTNPLLLSPFHDVNSFRKNSLPTPSCTSGIMASQVRRMSERGEIDSKKAREAAFLSTLQSVATNLTENFSQNCNRRHSFVTITKIPKSAHRRESTGNFPLIGQFANRKGTVGHQDSVSSAISDHLGGSRHSLQLDIMDDILNTRKLIDIKTWASDKIEPVNEVESPTEPRSFYSTLTSSSSDVHKIHKPKALTKTIDFVKKSRSESLDPTLKANWFVRRHLPIKLKNSTTNFLKKGHTKSNDSHIKIEVQKIGDAFENLIISSGPSTSKGNDRKSSFVSTTSRNSGRSLRRPWSWLPSMQKEKSSCRSLLKDFFKK